ncbi:hypothetical protein ACIRF8_11585 [Streptomyces sp. NPDC102406]|uniref:DUF7144 family membrane protein n=1 Tax=Streptomyces sp. NPDC102406 TaxID=3366171 RepID=UPI00381848F2
MADQRITPGQTTAGAPEPTPHVSMVGLGGVVFAVCIMTVIGGYHIIVGLSSILDSNYTPEQGDYTFDFDVNVRGWIQLISGAVVLAAAFLVFSGRTWARAVGITIATLSALENFFFVPYHPAWSAIIIVLDVLVIWSLSVYGHREAHKVYGAPL